MAVSGLSNTRYSTAPAIGTAKRHASLPTSTLAPSSDSKGVNSVYQEFDKYMKMTPAQHLRAHLLQELGLTEDDVKNMTPEQQQALEKQMQELMKKELQKTNATKHKAAPLLGQLIDTSA